MSPDAGQWLLLLAIPLGLLAGEILFRITNK